MAEARLDQIVKGAPASDKVLQAVPSSGVITSPAGTSPLHPSDPLASLPSSPPQIYLNLLILEASLRAQYLEIRARRRQYTIFLLALALWNLYFAYALFLQPREDGSGVGGSVYWVVEVTEKVAFMGGIVTGILVWGTGQWERGIRWPRRWVGITNRGLRGFNCKIVVVKGPWWKEWLSMLSFVFSNGLFSGNGGSSYRYIDQNLLSDTEKGSKPGLPNIHEDEGPIISHEEDLAPGGDTIKLLLLPKPFSPAFRENWDLYRTEYWERENERRRILLSKVQIQDKQLAKHQPRRSIFARFYTTHTTTSGGSSSRSKDVEKSHHGHGHSHSQHKHNPTGSNSGGPEKRLRASTSMRSGSHSRTPSRSTTPTPELEDVAGAGGGPGIGSSRPRRSSTASTTSSLTRGDSVRKKKPASSSSSAAATAAAARVQKLTPAGGAAAAAAAAALLLEHGGSSSLLARENRNSFSSTDGSSRPVTPAGDSESVRSMRMAATSGFGGGGPGPGPGPK